MQLFAEVLQVRTEHYGGAAPVGLLWGGRNAWHVCRQLRRAAWRTTAPAWVGQAVV